MGELVSAITNLCKLLDCLVRTSLKPDFFRLCKLNKLCHDQMQQMWDITHKLCCFYTSNEPCSNDSYKCVVNYLRKQEGVAAYFLSPDASARQLLLCFGFLLSRRIIESNIDLVLMKTPLGEELPSFMFEVNSVEPDGTFERPEDDPQALLNYVMFIFGKVKHNLRAVANYNQEKVQLLSKVHKATAGALGSHLSTGDLQMSVRPELQHQFLSRCQHCIPLLQAYSKWHRKRHIFWEWMLTVIEEEFKAKSKNFSVSEITHLHEFLRILKNDVQKSQMNEDDNSSEDTMRSLTERRLCRSENGEVLDCMIENMNLQINTLKIENKMAIQKIKNSNQDILIHSVLEMFCDTTNVKTEIMKGLDIEPPLVENLKIL